jgi:hypothetical protein
MMVFFCFMAFHNEFMKVPFSLSPSSSGHGEARTNYSCREELLSPEELGLLLLLLMSREVVPEEGSGLLGSTSSVAGPSLGKHTSGFSCF